MKEFLGCLIIAMIACQSIFAQMGCGTRFGKAVHLPKPLYTESIKFTNDIEIIEVKVEIDQEGSVTSAKTVSGNSAFAAISETAALNSRFSSFFPKIKYNGTIKYEFYSDSKSSKISFSIDHDKDFEKRIGIECAKINKPYDLRFKADDAILRIVNRLIQNEKDPNSEEIGFVINGNAKIGIRLDRVDTNSIKELQSLGVKISNQVRSEKSIVGQIPIEKLEHLLESKVVIYVFPFWFKSPPKFVI